VYAQVCKLRVNGLFSFTCFLSDYLPARSLCHLSGRRILSHHLGKATFGARADLDGVADQFAIFSLAWVFLYPHLVADILTSSTLAASASALRAARDSSAKAREQLNPLSSQ
jgi:hypothetical protein